MSTELLTTYTHPAVAMGNRKLHCCLTHLMCLNSRLSLPTLQLDRFHTCASVFFFGLTLRIPRSAVTSLEILKFRDFVLLGQYICCLDVHSRRDRVAAGVHGSWDVYVWLRRSGNTRVSCKSTSVRLSNLSLERFVFLVRWC